MQHPYLVDPNMEPPTTSRYEAHKQLVDASAKLRFLQVMLPKLKARGHRVLLFSQVSIMTSFSWSNSEIYSVRDRPQCD